MRGEVRAGRREGVRRWRGASGMHGGRPDSRLLEARARAERTVNIRRMVVTLEVSKLSGWLNAYAACRVEGRGIRCGASAGREAGGCGAVAAQAACTGKARLEAAGGQGTRGAHEEHEAHGRDLGGVPAGNVRVEVLQVLEEAFHVGDGRDVPVGDGAVRLTGGSRVSVVRLDGRH